MKGRAYVMKTTMPVPDEDREAARRLVERRAVDAAEYAEFVDMLGVAA